MENFTSISQIPLVAPASKAADLPIVFAVSDVPPAEKLLPEVSYYQAVAALIVKPSSQSYEHQVKPPPRTRRAQRTLEAYSQAREGLVASVQLHPLVAAVHLAFQEHRPLCLSPDMIWLLIAQGLADHINANAEQLRSHFVKHKDKLKIQVRRDNFVKGSLKNQWPEVFGEFSASIRQHLGEATHDLLVPTFSTTGPVEKAAAEIVLLDAMQSYFNYEVNTVCGIPQIKLEGTLSDWQELLERTKGLAQFELHWWINPLIPILEQFVVAVQGKPNKHFWQSIYKYHNQSGGAQITGWITTFFPYLKNKRTGKAMRQTQLLIQDEKELQKLKDSGFEGGCTVFKMDKFPSGLAIAPFCWQYLDSFYEMKFVAGFVGIRQDSKDLCLRPEIGWAICENNSIQG